MPIPGSTPAPPASTPVAPVRSSPRLNKTRADLTLTESPRKRRKIPTPSPRMATRASARKAGGEGEEATTPTPGGMGGSLDYGTFPFPEMEQPAPAEGEDLSTLFLQFQDEVPSAGVTLDSVFGTHDTNDILELLRGLEGDAGAGVSQSEP